MTDTSEQMRREFEAWWSKEFYWNGVPWIPEAVKRLAKSAYFAGRESAGGAEPRKLEQMDGTDWKYDYVQDRAWIDGREFAPIAAPPAASQPHATSATYPYPTIASAQSTVYAEIKVERASQDAKWGGPDHDDEHESEDWFSFIQEHLDRAENPDVYRMQMIRVAALAVAAIESFDRKRASAQPPAPAPSGENACDEKQCPHGYVPGDCAKRMTRCEYCEQGFPLKRWLDGSLRHFDGLMAWHRCAKHTVAAAHNNPSPLQKEPQVCPYCGHSVGLHDLRLGCQGHSSTGTMVSRDEYCPCQKLWTEIIVPAAPTPDDAKLRERARAIVATHVDDCDPTPDRLTGPHFLNPTNLVRSILTALREVIAEDRKERASLCKNGHLAYDPCPICAQNARALEKGQPQEGNKQ